MALQRASEIYLLDISWFCIFENLKMAVIEQFDNSSQKVGLKYPVLKHSPDYLFSFQVFSSKALNSQKGNIKILSN
jgi:hypothetical protein